MGQERKRRIIRILMELRDIKRGDNTFLIIINSKDNKQSFKEAERYNSKM